MVNFGRWSTRPQRLIPRPVPYRHQGGTYDQDGIRITGSGPSSTPCCPAFIAFTDLFPIREQGGAYFCPQEHVGFVDQVQSFLGRLNGKMNRFPVPAGTPEGDRSVKESVAAGLAALIAEHQSAVEAFGEDTRPSTLERPAERIRQTRFKISAYADYLAEEKARLEEQLAEAARQLRAKVEALADTGSPLVRAS